MKRNSPSTSTMAVDHNARKPLFLYCEEGEERPEFEEESKSEITSLEHNKFINHSSSSSSFSSLVPPPPPLRISEYDSRWEWDDDEHLQSLLSKERETTSLRSTLRFPSHVLTARKQAVGIVLRSSSFHGFSASAAILAVNFVDRFLLSGYVSYEKEKQPWLTQLVAVASLSLAAKVEETRVPLLLDFQAEDDEYLFEAKTIQRMELLILSALKWRMNAVTPISFIHHIVTRLGLKSYAIELEFLSCCENTILSLISDSRIVGQFPSVLAAATMLYVVRKVEWYGIDAVEYESTLFPVLKISKKEVEECYAVISDVISSNNANHYSSSKRSGSSICSDVIIDDEAVTANHYSSSSSSSPPIKKSRV